MFLFVIVLTLNPHRDLWLDNTEFAAKYCPGELVHLIDCTRSLAEATAAFPKARPGTRRQRRALENLQWWEEATTEAADRLDRAVGQQRDQIRSNPSYYCWPPRVTSAPTSGSL